MIKYTYKTTWYTHKCNFFINFIFKKVIKQLWIVAYTKKKKSKIVKFLHRKIDTLKKKKRK